MKITFQAPPKNLDERMISNVLRDYKMLNCEVLVRDENGIFISPKLFDILLEMDQTDSIQQRLTMLST